MILCVDIGNSATKLALVAGGEVAVSRRLANADTQGLARAAREMIESNGPPNGVGVSSVVPDATDDARDALAGLGKPIHVVTHRSRLPFRLDVPQPERVGVDRLCAAAGAALTDEHNAVVVDIGTAITVDRILESAFVGGAIMPGPAMVLRAMGRYASQLPAVGLTDVETLFPRTAAPTEAAMALGAGAATLGGIKEAMARLGGGEDPVWVTGGAVELYRGHLPEGWHLDPHLAARGLAWITESALADGA